MDKTEPTWPGVCSWCDGEHETHEQFLHECPRLRELDGQLQQSLDAMKQAGMTVDTRRLNALIKDSQC